jgi:hypothetical protein
MQAGTVAGACGLVLVAAGIAHAQTAAEPSLLSTLVGADVGTVTQMTSGVVCDNHLVDYNYKSPVIKSPHPCVNGPVHSGNSLNSGNFINHGNPNNSGNIANTNGTTNSANSVSGASSNSSNNLLKVLGGHPH